LRSERVNLPIFRKKKPEKALSREEILQLKPLRNPCLKWKKSETGEVVITLSLEEVKKKKFLFRLLPVPEEKKVSLDKIGTFVWEKCDGKHTVEQIAKELCDEYKMMRQEAEISLMTFLQQLSEKRFIGVLIPEVKEIGKEEENSTLRKMKIP
jgi:hypothetical protein